MLLALLTTLLLGAGDAGAPGSPPPPRLTAVLLTAYDSAAPGDTIPLAVQIEVSPPWHIYHPIILDTGAPTEISFETPAGVTVSPLRFPAPTLAATGPDDFRIEYLKHENTLTALGELTLANDVAPGTDLVLQATVRALACVEACIPVDAEARLTLPVTAEMGAARHAEAFADARAELPAPLAEAEFLKGSSFSASKPEVAIGEPFELVARLTIADGHHTQDRDPGVEGLIPTRVMIEPRGGIELADRDAWIWPAPHTREMPYIGKVREHSGELVIRVPARVTDPDFPAGEVTLDALLHYQVCSDAGQCFAPTWAAATARFTVNPQRTAPAETTAATAGGGPAAAPATPTDGRAAASLLVVFGAALLGGLILNIMPCVLPVISLKILGFVQQAGEDRGRVLRLGLVYAAGILVSFLPIAILMAQAGAAWGALMQSTAFVTVLIVIVFAFGLSLLGVFEVTLPGAAMSAAGDAASREGYGGAFLNGLMTTALATPCTAPFLGSAVGTLATQPPIVQFLGIMTVGVGLALPYVLLTAFPGWLRFLPKPGAWMIAFKQLVGFAMLAVVVWLLTLLPEDPQQLLRLLTFLVVLGLACWLVGRIPHNASTGRFAGQWAAAGALGLAGWAAAGWLFDESWQQIPWRDWSPGLPTELAREGDLVYVDYTAKWCLTCQANKRAVLETDKVRAAFERMGVVPIKADFTEYDQRIQAELNAYGRNGVPTNVVLPAGRPDQAILLPEVLTQEIVLGALEQATSEQVALAEER